MIKQTYCIVWNDSLQNISLFLVPMLIMKYFPIIFAPRCLDLIAAYSWKLEQAKVYGKVTNQNKIRIRYLLFIKFATKCDIHSINANWIPHSNQLYGNLQAFLSRMYHPEHRQSACRKLGQHDTINSTCSQVIAAIHRVVLA